MPLLQRWRESQAIFKCEHRLRSFKSELSQPPLQFARGPSEISFGHQFQSGLKNGSLPIFGLPLQRDLCRPGGPDGRARPKARPKRIQRCLSLGGVSSSAPVSLRRTSIARRVVFRKMRP
jgi:hypothetical protein